MHPKAVQHISIIAVVVFLMLALALLTGCAQKPIGQEGDGEVIQVNRLLFIPFRNMSVIYGLNKSVRSPFSGSMFLTRRVDSHGETTLNRLTKAQLLANADLETVTLDQNQSKSYNLLVDSESALFDRKLLTDAGTRAGVDAILIGYLYGFSERVGTKLSVQDPASVSFELVMIRTENGRVLWKKNFQETQQPLSDDLFKLESFLERGGKWVTAEELAQSGLTKMFKSFP
jgi:hypothetical protein